MKYGRVRQKLPVVTIERSGKIAALTPRVIRFLKEALGAVDLDEVQGAAERRADFMCLRGLLAVEMKTLEEDGSERIDNLTDELRQRDDWPIFLGSAPIQSFINNTNDPQGLHRRMLDRVGRAIVNHLKKANRQLEAHANSFPRRNLARALILINEDHEVYDPHTVGYILWHALRRMDGGSPIYAHVDFIIYLTERHAQMVDGLVVMPTLIVEGSGADQAPWKADLCSLITDRWTVWNGGKILDKPVDPLKFETINHIPESAPRHERWREEYRRTPYMDGMPEERVRDYFDEVTLLCMIDGLKDPPIPHSRERFTDSIRRFGDLILEMGKRAIPITRFPYDPQRAVEASRRLGLPARVEEFIWKHEREVSETAAD